MPTACSAPPLARLPVPLTLLLATDLQQSILAELAELADSLANGRAYSVYGSPASQRPPSGGLGFCGQFTEPRTGWYHLGNGHRVYNPVLMRFHSPDRLSPFGKGGLNAYAYCQGDPVGRVDPSGQSWLSLFGSGVGTALNGIFAGAAVNRAAAAIVTGKTPSMLTRAGNALSFWGGVTGLPSRMVGIPDAIAAPIPGSGMSIGSVVGTIGSQALTGLGAVKQNYVIARTWTSAATRNGQSKWRILWEATKEASGWNLLRGQDPGQVPVRTPDVPLESVVVESASPGHQPLDVDVPQMARDIRG